MDSLEPTTEKPEPKPRKMTDSKSIVVFIICFIIWISSGVYAIHFGNYDTKNPDLRIESTHIGYITRVQEFMMKLKGDMTWRSSLPAGILSFGSSLLCIPLLIIYSKVLTYVGITAQLFYIVFECYIVVQLINKFFVEGPSTLTLVNTFYIQIFVVYVGVSLYHMRYKYIEPISKIIKDACKTISCYPWTLLLSIVVTTLVIVASIFAGLVFLSLASMTQDWISNLLFFTNFIGFVWVALFLLDFNHLVNSTIFISWYNVEYNYTAPQPDVKSELLSVLRHHIGSICYGSSPLGILAAARAFITQGIGLLALALGYFFVSSLIFIDMFTQSSYTMTIIEGDNFYDASKKWLQLVLKHPLRFLVVTITSLATVFAACILCCIGFLVIYLFAFDGTKSSPQLYLFLAIIPNTPLLSLIQSLVLSGVVHHLYMVEHPVVDDTPDTVSHISFNSHSSKISRSTSHYSKRSELSHFSRRSGFSHLSRRSDLSHPSRRSDLSHPSSVSSLSYHLSQLSQHSHRSFPSRRLDF